MVDAARQVDGVPIAIAVAVPLAVALADLLVAAGADAAAVRRADADAYADPDEDAEGTAAPDAALVARSIHATRTSTRPSRSLPAVSPATA